MNASINGNEMTYTMSASEFSVILQSPSPIGDIKDSGEEAPAKPHTNSLGRHIHSVKYFLIVPRDVAAAGRVKPPAAV